MKSLICCLLAATLLLLCGCDTSPKDVTIDGTFAIVAAEDAQVAALSLQTTITHHTDLELELVSEAPEGAKTITVAVNPELAEGEYRTRLVKDGIIIEAQSEPALIIAMRSIRLRFIFENAFVIPFTTFDCENNSGTIDIANAPFTVLSQNIRYADDEGGNLVVQRAPRFQQLVEQYQPDILCMQEDNFLWVPILEKFFGDRYGFYGMYGDGPDVRGGKGGNKQLILYRSDRYELLEEGGFWLSDTPENASKLITSKGTRTCTWVLLKDRLTQQTLFVCNTHLDTISDEVRLAQLQILYQQVGSYMETYPTVFCGDFNARPDSPVYAEVTKTLLDPHETAAERADDYQFTYTAYGTTTDPRRLDYLFYNDQLIAQKYRIMTDTFDGYISDHYGVMTEYSFTK